MFKVGFPIFDLHFQGICIEPGPDFSLADHLIPLFSIHINDENIQPFLYQYVHITVLICASLC